MSKLNPLLRLAAISGVETALALHIRRGDDLDARDASGATPLILAAARSKKGAVKLLLEAGADPTILNLKGKDALFYALAAGCDETAMLLNEAQARSASDKTKISETSPAEYMVPALVDDPATSLSTPQAPATFQTADVESSESGFLTTVSFKVESQETEDLGSRSDEFFLDEAPLEGRGLDDWEAETESTAPRGDESVKDTAIQLHQRIGRHKAIASDEGWEEVDLYLPDRATPLAIEEDEGGARMLLLGALREGVVSEGVLEDTCSYVDGIGDEDAERLLGFVATELGATILEWMGKSEQFQGEPSEAEELLLGEAVKFLRELSSGENNPFFLYSREIRSDRLDAEGEKILGREMEDAEADALKELARWPDGLAFLFDAADRVARGEANERDFCSAPEKAPEDERIFQGEVVDIGDEEEGVEPGEKLSSFVSAVSVVQATLTERGDEKRCIEALRDVRLARHFLLALAGRFSDNKDAMEFIKVAERLSASREKMTLCNLRLALFIAKKYQWSDLPLDDLIQEANIGLMKAVDRFDWRKGFRFSTYATWWIRQQVARAIADKGRTVRVPVHMWEAARKFERQKKKAETDLGRIETETETVERVGIPLSKVRQLQSVLEEIESLDELDQEIGMPRVDLLVGSDDSDPALVLEEFALRTVLLRMLDELGDRAKTVVTLRFGLGNEDPLTLEEVGQRFGVTRERIRQIEAKAILKLSHKSRTDILAPFLVDDFLPDQPIGIADSKLVRAVESKTAKTVEIKSLKAKEPKLTKVVEYKNKFSPQSRKLARLALRQLGKDTFDR